MRENPLKASREIAKSFSHKYPESHINTPSFEEALQTFFKEEARLGTVYTPTRAGGSIYINILAFIKGLGMIYSEGEKDTAKTIEASTEEDKLIIHITVDGELPPRDRLAVITRIMAIAGFTFACNNNEIQLVTKILPRETFTLYENEPQLILNLLRMEFM